jgi:acetyl esterase
MMTHPLRLIALASIILFPLSLAAQRPALPEPTEKRVYKEIGDTKLELWIYKPADWRATDRRSAIVFYHGGGWRKGSPKAFSRQSAQLAGRGMVAISVQYRLTSQAGVTVVECVKDAKSAFRWVKAHAKELGIDGEKIAAGGGSAGGHLAATLATLDAINDENDDTRIGTRPAALVLFNPALRLNSPREQEATSPAAPSRAAVSPYEHVKRAHPPTIIFHGEADTTVPIKSAREYAAKVKSLGGACEVVGFADQQHAFFNREPFVWDTLKQAESFLEKLSLLPKAARASATAAKADH